MKDALEAGAHVAEVLIALLAVWPLVMRAIQLVRTVPPMTKEQRRQRNLLMVDNRMGWFQKVWTRFLMWARRERKDLLTWREARYRMFWCPLRRGHNCGEPTSAGGVFVIQCKDCKAGSADSDVEALRLWASKGKEDRQDYNYRERVDPMDKVISDAANKLADALQTVVSPPH